MHRIEVELAQLAQDDFQRVLLNDALVREKGDVAMQRVEDMRIRSLSPDGRHGVGVDVSLRMGGRKNKLETLPVDSREEEEDRG